MPASKFDKRLRIEKPGTDAGFAGAGERIWTLVEDDVPANVEDMLPSRGERMADGINVARRPARVRMRLRDDVTAEMRFVMGPRVMQITAGPADLNDRRNMEFMVEDYSTAGNGA